MSFYNVHSPKPDAAANRHLITVEYDAKERVYKVMLNDTRLARYKEESKARADIARGEFDDDISFYLQQTQ